MKKIKVVLYSILMTGVFLCIQGCTVAEINNITDLQQDKIEIEFELPEQILELKLDLPIEIASSEAQENEIIVEKTEVPDIYYIYHKLDDKKQKLYMEIYNVLSECKEDVVLSTTDKKLIDELFVCVMNDHPELFYADGYKCTEYSLNGKITEISFSGTYSMTFEDARHIEKMITEEAEYILSGLSADEDEYCTIKYIYDFLINNTQYNKNSENNQNICSVFLNKESVCQGYAKAMQYLLHKTGIQCLLITGNANGESHAWNLVRINDKYYYLDPTWGDASYFYTGDAADSNIYPPEINYDYFLVTTEEITKNHSIEQIIELPECKSIEDNYFYREGLYLESYDEEKLKIIFDAMKNGEKEYVMLKCSSMEIYNEIFSKLILEKKIFEIIENQEKNMAYASNESLSTISFWITD